MFIGRVCSATLVLLDMNLKGLSTHIHRSNQIMNNQRSWATILSSGVFAVDAEAAKYLENICSEKGAGGHSVLLASSSGIQQWQHFKWHPLKCLQVLGMHLSNLSNALTHADLKGSPGCVLYGLPQSKTRIIGAGFCSWRVMVLHEWYNTLGGCITKWICIANLCSMHIT